MASPKSSSSENSTPPVAPPTGPPFSIARILAMPEIDQSEFDWPSWGSDKDTVESEPKPGPGFKLVPAGPVRRGVRAMRPSPGMDHWQLRRCSHCSAEKTPKWRPGPQGPNTLCNACWMRYKSGRLWPEYRPANSPTSDPEKNSHLHNKVLELRNRNKGT